MDIKGLYIPEARSLVLGNAKEFYTQNTSNHNQKNTAGDTDLEMFSLSYFIKLATKGETIALDMIHTPSNLIIDYDFIEPWDFIVKNRSKYYTTDMKAYLGYVKKQAAKYGIKGTRMAALRQVWDAIKGLPEYEDVPGALGAAHLHYFKVADYRTRLPINDFCKFAICEKTGNEFYEIMGSKHQLTIKMSELKYKVQAEWNKYGERARLAELNQGIDWKAMHHAIRGGLQLKEIYSTGDLQYPLVDAEELVKIKKGEISFKTVSEFLEDIISDVDKLSVEASKNGMPSKVDSKFWDDFVFEVYHDHIMEFGRSRDVLSRI